MARIVINVKQKSPQTPPRLSIRIDRSSSDTMAEARTLDALAKGLQKELGSVCDSGDDNAMAARREADRTIEYAKKETP